MSQNKVHTQGNVPFSWENQPGISKSKVVMINCPKDVEQQLDHLIKLPLPPCLTDSSPRVSGQDCLQNIPLPPCPFQPSTTTRSNSRKGLLIIKRQDHQDPFLAAYKECTKSGKQKKSSKNSKRSGDHHQSGFGFMFSCKHSCGVREDSLIKAHVPSAAHPALKESRSQNERNELFDPSNGSS